MLRRLCLLCLSVLCLRLVNPLIAADGLTAQVRFEFREPQLKRYRVEPAPPRRGTFSIQPHTDVIRLKAWPEDGSTNYVEFGNRVVLELKQAGDPKALLAGKTLRVARVLTDRTFILQGTDTLIALREAAALAKETDVAACYPVMRRKAKLHSGYARKPNDPYFYRPDLPNSEWQWHLENRDSNGTPLGVDLNVRAAWALSRGRGITLAIADDGFEMEHPDLAPQVTDAPHFNFHAQDINVGPSGFRASHATAVAGLVAAAGDNAIGISGVAPAATLANWVLFDSNDDLPDEEQVMDMFQFKSNIVSVQNHSWGKIPEDPQQLRASLVERIGISNAVAFGRGGRGVVMVRSAGNGRSFSSNADDDEYPSDPRVIAVAAARLDGRVARYSSPGACILVAAPSGDDSSENNPCITNSPNLFTTDRSGSAGYNRQASADDLADYGFGETGFSGTSAAAPQITGVVALILGANPNLTYRDVQQVLLLSARHFDTTDPDLRTNGAGLRVSHNLGFGVPDAGFAVTLASAWSNRPPVTTISHANSNASPIPDLALRVVVEGTNVPENLASIVALPGSGVHPDQGTVAWPVEDIGSAEEPITKDLKGHAALVQRDGKVFFCDKLNNAAQAGAAMAVVYNHIDQTQRIVMGGIDFIPIPAVMISQIDGEALQGFLQANPDARVRLQYEPARYSFDVRETLVCEHVGVRVDTDHTRRGDLRITLVSPRGTRSVLQAVNTDDSPGPVDWTYYSTQHFFEGSAGTWTVEIGDEDEGGAGSVTSVNLTINGVAITDLDHDGLADDWETRYFHSLAYGAQDDPEHDGFNNAREQVMMTDPTSADVPFKIDLSVWDEHLARLSWPGNARTSYQVRLGIDSTAPLTTITNIPGRFPETEWFVPYTDVVNQFFRVQALPTKQ